MKKIIPVLIFLLLPTAVFAKNQQAGSAATPVSTPINTWAVVKERNIVKTKIQNEIKEQTQVKEETRERVQAKLQEKNQNRIRTYYGRLSQRINAATGRLNTLGDRILTRLDVLKEEGVDTQEFETKVENAQVLIANADDILKDSESLVEQMVESDDPASLLPTLKEAVTEIKDGLKDSHSILVEVVTGIQGLRVEAEN